jgi:diacylglycerol O-acyltransferase
MLMTKATRLAFQDNVFLLTESGSEMHHISGIFLLKKPAKAPQNYVGSMLERMREYEPSPTYRSKLKYPYPTPTQEWIDDTSFNLDFHLRHVVLPAPGSLDQLHALANVLHSQRMDLHRPLWETIAIDGIEGDRFALFVKLHHAMVDGAGVLKILDKFFSRSSRSKTLIPPWHLESDAKTQRAPNINTHSMFSSLERRLQRSWRRGNDLTSLSTELIKRVASWSLSSKSARKSPFNAPRTRINADISNNREVHTVSIPLPAMKALSGRSDSTLNDILLTICGMAVTRYLDELNELPDKPLIASIPISLKEADAQMGNQLALAHCDFLHESVAATTLLEHVRQIMIAEKAKYKNLRPSVSRTLANISALPVIFLTMLHLASKFNPSFNFVVSNVKGPERSLYLAGAKLEDIVPMSVLFNGQALNITAISYAGKLRISVLVCPRQVPEAYRLVQYIEESFQQLQATLR